MTKIITPGNPRGRRTITTGKVVITNRNGTLREQQVGGVGHTHHKSYVVGTAATDLVFRFAHYSMATVKEAVAAAAFTLRASVRVNGQNHEITSNGLRDLVINPGAGYIDSDPVSVGVNAGDTIIVNTYIVSAATLPYATGWSAVGQTYGDTYTLSTDATGPTAAVGASVSAQLYGPSLVYGTPKAGAIIKPVIAIIGDSIGRGWHDNAVDTGGYGGDGGGFAARALNPGGFPWINICRASSSGNDWTDLYGRKVRAGMIADADYAIVHLGSNDMLAQSRTDVQAETSLVSVCKTLLADRGIIVFVCTVVPNSSSTDNWATLANQTIATPYNTYRVPFNNWIRDGCPINNATSLTPVATGTSGALRAGQLGHPVTGYFELADTCESSRDSGLWKVDGNPNTYTTDGTHPATQGHTAMAGAVNSSKFV